MYYIDSYLMWIIHNSIFGVYTPYMVCKWFMRLQHVFLPHVTSDIDCYRLRMAFLPPVFSLPYPIHLPSVSSSPSVCLSL